MDFVLIQRQQTKTKASQSLKLKQVKWISNANLNENQPVQ